MDEESFIISLSFERADEISKLPSTGRSLVNQEMSDDREEFCK